MQFDRHTLVLLVRPPDAPELTDEEADELQDRHLAFRADLRDRGQLIGGGALVDPDGQPPRGISVMAVATQPRRPVEGRGGGRVTPVTRTAESPGAVEVVADVVVPTEPRSEIAPLVERR